MYLIGAGGHAKVVIDILRANNIEIEGIYDSNPNCEDLLNIPFLGSEEGKSFDAKPVIISIGNNQTRKKVASGINDANYVKAIHPSSIISDNVMIGEGTVIMHGAIIQNSGMIGKHVIINTGASVDHDCIIDDFAHISPGVVLCGNVHIGEGSHIGAGAVCIPGIKVGKWCTVGAGAVVTKNIPDYTVAVGTPARVIKHKDEVIFNI
ncbi:MAG: acetyltransferase [Tannerella sp.]|jgi:acetyltransferase EpsM|nr:acetyltransferase [Tannerella sp.]